MTSYYPEGEDNLTNSICPHWTRIYLILDTCGLFLSI